MRRSIRQWDTAETLARAGYIVATIRHAGDNSRDHTGLGTDRYLDGRLEQISTAPAASAAGSTREAATRRLTATGASAQAPPAGVVSTAIMEFLPTL